MLKPFRLLSIFTIQVADVSPRRALILRQNYCCLYTTMASSESRKRPTDESDPDISGSRSAKRPRVAQTCEWIEQEPAFTNWARGVASPVLWINGSPGSGKTFLAEHIVNVLGADPEQPSTACFYCHAGTAPSSILRSILSQIVSAEKTPAQDRSAVSKILEENTFGQEPVTDDFHVGWDHFSLAAKTISPFNLILDGVDELPDTASVSNEVNLVQRLVQLALADSASLKLCFLSRNQPALHRTLNGFPSIVVTPDKVNDDIRRFALALISEHSNLVPYMDQIADKLVEDADGIFLWVQYSIQALSLEPTEAAILQRLQDLPRFLNDLYADLITKTSDQLIRSDLPIRDTILRWTVTAVRPLQASELGNAISLDTNSFITDVESRAIDLCGPLIKLENGTVRIMHHTFRDFLRSSHPGLEAMSDIDVQSAHKSIARACLTYLSHPAFEDLALGQTQPGEVQATSDYPLLEYASLYWIYHFTEAGTLALELSNRVIEFLESPNAFIWMDRCLPRFLSRCVLPVPPRPQNAARFAFLFNLKAQLLTMFPSPPKDGPSPDRDDIDGRITNLILRGYVEALETDTERYGREGPLTIKRMLDVGEVYGWLPGARQESNLRFTEALDLVQRLGLTSSHEEDISDLVVMSFQAQADALKRGGKYEEAGELLTQLLEILKRQAADQGRDANIMFALDSLGWVCMRLGRLEEAATHLERALDLASIVYGSTSSMTVRSRMTLAEVLQKLGRSEEAEQLCQDLVDQLREHRLNGVHLPRDSVTQLNTLAGVYMAQKNFAGAVDTFEVVVEDRARMFGKDHPMTLWACMQLGLAREAGGEDRDSLTSLFEELVPRQEQVLGSDHPDVRTSKGVLEKLAIPSF
jgi:Tetratricopeptide repeat/NACHT domain